jgi:hypothetical protein
MDHQRGAPAAHAAAIHNGCDRAIPNPNRLVKSFAYKINCLLKNIVWLYKPSSHANVLDAGP